MDSTAWQPGKSLPFRIVLSDEETDAQIMDEFDYLEDDLVDWLDQFAGTDYNDHTTKLDLAQVDLIRDEYLPRFEHAVRMQQTFSTTQTLANQNVWN